LVTGGQEATWSQEATRSETALWAGRAEDLFRAVATGPQGLSPEEADSRRLRHVRRSADGPAAWRAARILATQFRSPLTIILIAAAALSLFLRDNTDAAIILTIVLAGAGLGFWQEYTAANALAALLALVSSKVTVLRGGRELDVEADEIVPGDIVLLSAGSKVPGDCRLLEAKDLFVNESTLTGETYAVEKQPGELPPDTPLARRSNVLFHGTHVVCGTARAVVARTGEATELGRISQRLRLRPPETDFERGVRRFGYFLMEVTLLLVLTIFAIHVATRESAMESLLFALALAVGLTPQLLPAVIAVNLSHGARRLAACQVIVRRLASIENFGAMTVLCSDKTGTLTEGTVRFDRAVDYTGQNNERATRLAWLNARYETGFANPIDEALRGLPAHEGDFEKLDEIPYDFLRKRLSVLVRDGQRRLLITKGAVENVLAITTRAETASGESVELAAARPQIDALYQELGSHGYRTLAVAYREIAADRVQRSDEDEMTFVGLLALRDPPKPGVAATIRQLQSLGVTLKMITGDNRLVAANVAEQVGLDGPRILVGEALRQLSDDALLHQAGQVDVFAEIEPNQKERIILALKKAGHVVGYLGDGINDATALHAADVGISVDQAVDVAKEAADIVLLRRDLDVLVDGVREGRATFANTLKYIFLATSANFGNMFSMAGVSLFLPFLPLLPKQILLTNLLTDLPEMTIARDSVDAEMTARPQRWNIGLLQRFMLVFGALSSVFDYLTFAVLLGWLRSGEEEFRTGWFVESVVSACVAVLVVRSRRPLWQSQPARLLLVVTAVVIAASIALPYTPLARPLGFTPLPLGFLAAMLAIVLLYAASAELVKRWFYRSSRSSLLASPPK
jgi:Mg2+-importing ATPase